MYFPSQSPSEGTVVLIFFFLNLRFIVIFWPVLELTAGFLICVLSLNSTLSFLTRELAYLLRQHTHLWVGANG